MLQDDFKQMLKEKGLKVTRQRILVLETLATCDDKHLTVEEIYEIVKADYRISDWPLCTEPYNCY